MPLDAQDPDTTRPGSGELPTEVACSLCGRSSGGPPPLSWSSSHGPRGTSWVCGACTRQHLRAMEAQLDQEHW